LYKKRLYTEQRYPVCYQFGYQAVIKWLSMVYQIGYHALAQRGLRAVAALGPCVYLSTKSHPLESALVIFKETASVCLKLLADNQSPTWGTI